MKFIRDIVYKIPVSPAIQEGILEALRLGVIVFLSTLLTALINYFKTLPNYELVVLFLTILGRYLDKWKFESNKSREVEGAENTGLVGF